MQTGHGTQKPIEVMRRPVLNHTERGDAVYDPFLGSGTTLIAAEATERVCYGLEIDPQYCEVIVRRWQEFTGREATPWPLMRGIDVDGEIDSGLPVAILDAQTEGEVPVRGGVPRNSAGACIEA